jgi:ribonucleoside-triphosphate reductase
MIEMDFLDEISKFIFTSKYARYDENLKRRETWEETVDRVQSMHLRKFRLLAKEDKEKIKWAFSLVKNKRIVPAMRSLQFGGKAVEAHNAKLFNCCVTHIDSIRSIAESMYLLLNGCGVGFGLSNLFLGRLPDLVDKTDKNGTVITYVIQDTIEGWADSVEALLSCYFRNTIFSGRKIIFDYSRIRPEGAPLKTSGGKAPGYKGLKAAHKKIKELLDHIIEEEHVKRIRTIHVYDILMHCADAVLSGGVRRSACSVIFQKDDLELMNAKTNYTVSKRFKFSFDEDTDKYCGKVKVNDKTHDVELTKFEYEELLVKQNKIWWNHIEPQRARSNNSVLLIRTETTREEFSNIIQRTKEYGEPGFVWANNTQQLFNPCFEVAFIPISEDGQCGVQFCNLTSINGARIHSKEDFFECVEAATIIGTLQASYTDFKYLRPVSKQITEEEALLGVSITGIMDNPKILLDPTIQKSGAELSKIVNEKWAKIVGINPAARITVVKPEGTSSLVLGSASGIHPHHAKRYFRRVQCNKLENPYKFLRSINPHACEESRWSANKTDDIVTFPIELTNGAMTKTQWTALKHLEAVKNTQVNWVNTGTSKYNKKNISHNVSCTISVKEDEWEAVIDYIFQNRKFFSAVSLLPSTGDKDYPQAPNEAISTPEDEKKWQELVARWKPVDFTKMSESEDETIHVQEASCAGGRCEVF